MKKKVMELSFKKIIQEAYWLLECPACGNQIEFYGESPSIGDEDYCETCYKKFVVTA